MNEARTYTHSSSLAHAVGRAVLEGWDAVLGLYGVFVRTLYFLARGKRERGDVTKQMYVIGNRSLPFICVTMGFIGMILVYQAGTQTKRILPEFGMLGAAFTELLVRDLAASIGGLMLATRIGAGIAAEIGSMVVTEQVDALRMSGADPVDYLIVPRFIASLVMTTVLIVLGGLVAFVTGMVTAWAFFDVRFDIFANLQLVDAGDLIVGLTKCVTYGAAIPLVSGYAGLSTSGGSEGVGSATTRAVVNSSLAILVLNLIISAAGFVVFR